jgi:hypothetical protein
VSSLPALTFLDVSYCDQVTAAGVQALRNTTAAPNLEIAWGEDSEEDLENDSGSEESSDESEDWETDESANSE